MNPRIFEILELHRIKLFLFGVLVALLLMYASLQDTSPHIESVLIQDVGINNAANVRDHRLFKFQKSGISNIQNFEISFKGRAQDSNYGNFFQTDDGQKAIRLELNKPNDLTLIFYDDLEGIYKVSEEFSLNEWHDIKIIGVHNQYIKLFLDSKLVFFATNELIQINKSGGNLTLPPNSWLTNIQSDFGNFVIGSGFTRERDLVGEIKDFNLRIDFLPKWNVLNALSFAIMVLILVSVSGFYRCWFSFRIFSRFLFLGFFPILSWCFIMNANCFW